MGKAPGVSDGNAMSAWRRRQESALADKNAQQQVLSPSKCHGCGAWAGVGEKCAYCGNQITGQT